MKTTISAAFVAITLAAMPAAAHAGKLGFKLDTNGVGSVYLEFEF